MNRALYWFTQDLRLQDNEGVKWAAQTHEQVAFVYVINPVWFAQKNYHHMTVGKHRWRFICESLIDLNEQLSEMGHHLQLLVGEPSEQIGQYIKTHNVGTLVLAQQFGVYEQRAIARICQCNSTLTVEHFSQTTLFDNSQVSEHDLPMKSFSTFRNYVEKQSLAISVENVFIPQTDLKGIDSFLPALSRGFDGLLSEVNAEIVPFDMVGLGYMIGGEHCANNHLNDYFNSYAPSKYKETRNNLDGFYSSTKLSAYLAIGNLSPRQVWHRIEEYERTKVKNESTYWLKFELLWREYFQWLLKFKGTSFFLFKGDGRNKPMTSFYANRFAAWCAGETAFPLVNACMHQLNETGYMSNRGRQIVASCLVNELSVDWRYGAAYFQQQLIDYDVASNWGNWQYIAGVGVDPRGGRHFNIPKQAQLYDAEGQFVKKWRGHSNNEFAYDCVDPSDWPFCE
ncbi:DASH family cryptochrome [Pseudoalteromonas sp. T1lg23B]|uniref:DASH family cryptochrome n=1 Tax=Pseudoalteromonas sp. T1lg23B TaxID=2077097 RepID=UPI000CF605D2|nr:DASH family cryptochrome [Pseudoalteromonas sp. T1lg23B]